jgi:hypothetical protein
MKVQDVMIGLPVVDDCAPPDPLCVHPDWDVDQAREVHHASPL